MEPEGTDPDDDRFAGTFYEPFGPGPHSGALVFHGSQKGEIFEQFARRLAVAGVVTLHVEFYDAPGAPDEFAEVPLSYVERAVDWLAERADGDRLGVVGFSRSTELAFLLAARDDRVGPVVAYAPSAYTFPGFTEPETSAWAADGDPLPYVPGPDGMDDASTRERFRAAVERADEETLDAARLPVTDVSRAVLVSGGDDGIWQSGAFASDLSDRLGEAGVGYDRRHYPDAGHGIVAPYRDYADQPEWLGGTPNADAHAAVDAWPAVVGALRSPVE